MALTMKQVRETLRRRYEAQKTGNAADIQKVEDELRTAGIDRLVDYIGEVGIHCQPGAVKDWEYEKFAMVSLNSLYSME